MSFPKIVATTDDETVEVLSNNGDGTFGTSLAYDVGSDQAYTGVGDLNDAVALGDLDGDGDLDVIVTNRYRSLVTALMNDGVGVLGYLGKHYQVGDGPLGIAVGDLDGDMDLDVATANKTGGDVSTIFNLTIP